MPDGKKLQALSAELSATELNYAVQLLIDAGGIDKLRITGGEPLISKKFDPLLCSLKDVSLKDIAITTNGQFLKKKLPVILDAQVSRINVSLDTLDATAFRSIARSGDLATVLDGIEAALASNLKVKVNCVPIRTSNIDQLLPILEYCLSKNIELRYIELMNMGYLKHNQLYEREFVGMDEILEKISKRYEYYKIDAPMDSTSVRFEVPGIGRFGIIANESEPFCRTCTRLRLSSNGQIFGCLSNSKAFSIRQILDKPYPTAITELQSVLKSAMQLKQRLAFTGETTVMKFIGG